MLPELTLAERLIRLRGKQPLRRAAKGAGTDPSTLSRLESGERGSSKSPQAATLRGETLRRLAGYYGVLPEYLTGGLREYMRAWAQGALGDAGLASAGQRLGRITEELQLRYGVTLADLAFALDLEVEDLRAYIDERVPPGVHLLEQIEPVLGIPADWMLRGSAEHGAPAYQNSIALALSHGVSPETLSRLIRSWVARNIRG